MLKCSYRGKESKEGSSHCGECGAALEGERIDAQPSQLCTTNDPKRSAAEKQMLHGVLWCAGGIVVTIATYVAAASSPSASEEARRNIQTLSSHTQSRAE